MLNRIRLFPGVVVLTSRGYQYVENLDPDSDRLVSIDPWTHQVAHYGIQEFRLREADLRRNWLSCAAIWDPVPFPPSTRIVCKSNNRLVSIPVRIVNTHVRVAFLDRIPEEALGTSVVSFPGIAEAWYRIQTMNFNRFRRLLNSGEPVEGISPVVLYSQFNGHHRSRFFVGLFRLDRADREWILLRHKRKSERISFTFRSLEDGFNFRSLYARYYRTTLDASRDSRYLKTVVVTVYRDDPFPDEVSDYRFYPVRVNYSQRFPSTEITIMTEAPFLVVNSYCVCTEKVLTHVD